MISDRLLDLVLKDNNNILQFALFSCRIIQYVYVLLSYLYQTLGLDVHIQVKESNVKLEIISIYFALYLLRLAVIQANRVDMLLLHCQRALGCKPRNYRYVISIIPCCKPRTNYFYYLLLLIIIINITVIIVVNNTSNYSQQ